MVGLLLELLDLVHLLSVLLRVRYLVPLAMVQTYLKLHILEIFDLARPQVLVVDRLASLKAALRVEPTVLIELGIVPHFDEYAYLGHHFVTETDVARFDVDAAGALRIALFLRLLPDVKVDASRRVVFLPLRKAAHCFITLGQISYV